MNDTDLWKMATAEARHQAAADVREYGRRTAERMVKAAEQYTDPEILEAPAKQRDDIAWAIEGAAKVAAAAGPTRAPAAQPVESRV